MNRRDFLLFRTEGPEKIAELSCEKLYMHFTDSLSAQYLGQAESGTAAEAEWWAGEPPAVFSTGDPQALFDDMAAEISDVDVLLVNGKEWLVEEFFMQRVEKLLAQFSAEGGRVIYAKPQKSEDSTMEKP